MAARELVLMVEGDSEAASVPGLVHRLLDGCNGHDALYVGTTMRVGGLQNLVHAGSEERWLRFLHRAALKPNLGAVLLLLDGDTKARHPLRTSEGEKVFCARTLAGLLARLAERHTEAGKQFSVAVVFARQEFESWLLAGCPELASRLAGTVSHPEEAPRDAKGRIAELTGVPYKETTHQPHYTRRLDVDVLLNRVPKMRSFHRMQHAMQQLTEAARSGRHVCTPQG